MKHGKRLLLFSECSIKMIQMFSGWGWVCCVCWIWCVVWGGGGLIKSIGLIKSVDRPGVAYPVHEAR